MATAEEIREIKERADIIAIVSRFVQLKKTGRTWVGLCPFHNEKTPSFHVSPQLGIFKCFGCGKSGDVINFLEEIEHSDFGTVIENLARETGVTLSRNRFDDKVYKKISRGKELNRRIAKLYNLLLVKHKVGADALKYLKENRKLNDSSIAQFLIGYAPKNKDIAIRYAQKLKFTDEELIEFSIKNDKGVDKFFHRIIFPIKDLRGDIVGFSGRTIEKEDIRPKYLNTSETPLYKKRSLLFGLFQGKEAIVNENLAIICEGQMDVISSHQAGVKNLVAPLGTGLTEEQLKILSRYTKNIAFAFDTDSAGQKSTERATAIALSLDLTPLFIRLPKDVQDIDELCRNNPTKWQELSKSPENYLTYKFSELKTLLKKDYKLFEAELTKVLSIINNAKELKKEILLKELSKFVGIDKEVLKRGFEGLRKLTHSSPNEPNENEQNIKRAVGKTPKLSTEEYVLSIILNYPYVLLTLKDKAFLKRFKNAEITKIITEVIIFVNEIKPELQGNLVQISMIFDDKFKKDYRALLNYLAEDNLIAATIEKCGITKIPEDITEVEKEFETTVQLLRKIDLDSKLRKIQEEFLIAELQKDKPKIAKLEKELKRLNDELRKELF